MELLWKILLLVLVLVLVSAEDKKVMEVRDLGGDVTLTCSINIRDMFWYMEIHHQLRANIGRTFSSDPEYSSPDFETKYLIQENRLVIKNLTAEDFRRYFCGQMKNRKIMSVDTFHLISVPVVSVTPDEDLNHQPGTTDEPGIRDTRTWKNGAFVLSSFCLIIILTLVVVGLTCRYFRRKRSSCRMKDPSRFTPENSETLENAQDEDVDLFPSGIMSECLYHKVQLPGRLSAD